MNIQKDPWHSRLDIHILQISQSLSLVRTRKIRRRFIMHSRGGPRWHACVCMQLLLAALTVQSHTASASRPDADTAVLLQHLATEAGSQEPGKHCEWSGNGEFRGAPKCVECDTDGTCTPLAKSQTCTESCGNAVHKKKMRRSSPRGPDYFRFGQKETCMRSNWYDIRNCTVQRCVDLTRCPSATKNIPLAVYIYPPAPTDEPPSDCPPHTVGPLLSIDLAAAAKELAATSHSTIRVVDNPGEACLLVVTARSFLSPEAMTSAPTWNEGSEKSSAVGVFSFWHVLHTCMGKSLPQ